MTKGTKSYQLVGKIQSTAITILPFWLSSLGSAISKSKTALKALGMGTWESVVQESPRYLITVVKSSALSVCYCELHKFQTAAHCPDRSWGKEWARARGGCNRKWIPWQCVELLRLWRNEVLQIREFPSLLESLCNPGTSAFAIRTIEVTLDLRLQ